MDLLSLCLLVAGICITLFSTVWFIAVAFRRHVAWGLAVLFVPLANLVFLCCQWRRAKRPVFGTIVGILLCCAAVSRAPDQKWLTQLRLQFARLASKPDPAEQRTSVASQQSEVPVSPEIADLRIREQALRARKAVLNPNDAAAAATLARDINSYNSELAAHAPSVLLEKAAPLPTSLWVQDLTQAPIPSAPARGAIDGEPFNIERVTLENDVLTLRQGTGVFADHEFSLVLFMNGRSPAGRNFQVRPDTSLGALHVHMKRLAKGQKLPQIQSFMNGYSLRLEFGERVGNEIPGRIYLCLPDPAKSYVAGTFRARLGEKSGGVAMSR
jgi:hypothetical protein